MAIQPETPDHLPADLSSHDPTTNHQDNDQLISDPQRIADHQLLPDTLPEGDPLDYARPVFLTEPEDSYVIKSRPAELSCKVYNFKVIRIQFGASKLFYNLLLMILVELLYCTFSHRKHSEVKIVLYIDKNTLY